MFHLPRTLHHQEEKWAPWIPIKVLKGIVWTGVLVKAKQKERRVQMTLPSMVNHLVFHLTIKNPPANPVRIENILWASICIAQTPYFHSGYIDCWKVWSINTINECGEYCGELDSKNSILSMFMSWIWTWPNFRMPYFSIVTINLTIL
jgi:hypothetical protein